MNRLIVEQSYSLETKTDRTEECSEVPKEGHIATTCRYISARVPSHHQQALSILAGSGPQRAILRLQSIDCDGHDDRIQTLACLHVGTCEYYIRLNASTCLTAKMHSSVSLLSRRSGRVTQLLGLNCLFTSTYSPIWSFTSRAHSLCVCSFSHRLSIA